MDIRSIYWQDADQPPILDVPLSWQMRLQRHSQREKSIQAQFAYGLLAEMVGKHLGYLPELASQGGKPYFPQHPQLHFSLSHTKGAAMVALGAQEVGVDIEQVRPVSQHMMMRVAQTHDLETFFTTWVQREAIGKCLGTGISALGQVAQEKGVGCQLVAAAAGYHSAVATKR